MQNMLSYRIEERVLEVAEHTIRTGSTVRETAEVFGVSKTTIHLDLSKRLPEVNRQLAEQVQEVLSFNLNERHLRGGEATREKYKDIRVAS